MLNIVNSQHYYLSLHSCVLPLTWKTVGLTNSKILGKGLKSVLEMSLFQAGMKYNNGWLIMTVNMKKEDNQEYYVLSSIIRMEFGWKYIVYLGGIQYFSITLIFESKWYTISLAGRLKNVVCLFVLFLKDQTPEYSSERNFRNVKRRTFSCFWQMRNQFFQVIAYSKCQGITTKL